MSNQNNYMEQDGVRNYPKGQAARLRKVTRRTYALLALGIVSLLLFSLMVVNNTLLMREQMESTVLLNQYRLASKTLTTNAQSYAILGEEKYLEAYNQELNVDKNREKAWEGLEQNHIDPWEWALLEEVKYMSNALATLEAEAFTYVEKGKLDNAKKIMYGAEYLEQMQKISSTTDDVISRVENRMEEKRDINMMILFGLEGLFLVMFAFLAGGVLRTTRFAKKELLIPIVEVSEQMEALANGDFQKKLDLEESESEVGTMIASIHFMKDNFVRMINEISEALAEMSEGNYQIEIVEEYVGDFVAIKETLLLIIEDTKKMLTTVVEASEEIEDSADKLAEAAVNLADGSTMQAQQVTEIVELIGEMTKDLEAGVGGAKETVLIATEAAEALANGNEKMIELKKTIAQIQQKEEEIHEVIASLRDTANETNVLSLDAAIEASRAGEAGRGFVVVAEQIKNLSEVSAEACERTLGMIANVVQAVNKCVEIADVTSVNMEEVMERAKVATEQMSAIADGLVLEEAKIKNINVLVDEIAQVVDNNSATSEETAAISEVQASKAQTMVQLMHRFKI